MHPSLYSKYVLLNIMTDASIPIQRLLCNGIFSKQRVNFYHRVTKMSFKTETDEGEIDIRQHLFLANTCLSGARLQTGI